MESGFSRIRIIALIALVAIAGAAVFVWRSRNALPAPGSDTYEQVTRTFYIGLASLEVGLLDDAKRHFTTVTGVVAKEPAAWANLGLAHLRLGELDEAAPPIDRAVMLAPDNADLVLLAGRMEIARGRLDEGLAHLRRAVELAPDALLPRFALAEEVERAAAPDADAQALMLLDDLTKLVPQNIAVLVERARIAAKGRDLQRLTESIARLEPMAAGWPPPAVEQYQALQQAVTANDLGAAQRATAFLRNVLARVPAFGEDLSAIRTPVELIAEPMLQFIAMQPPTATPAEPDLELGFREEAIDPSSIGRFYSAFLFPREGDRPPRVFAVDGGGVRALTGTPGRVFLSPFTYPPTRDWVLEDPSTIVAVADWNNDFRRDIVTVVHGTLRVLVQQPDGTFADQTPKEAAPGQGDFRSVWTADVEMDGDIDIVAAPWSGGVVVLRNDANGSWTPIPMFDSLEDVTAFEWADVDGDADPDAVFLTRKGAMTVLANRQAGSFSPLPNPTTPAPHSITIADMNADGLFEIVALEDSGTISASSFDGKTWLSRQVATWPDYEGGPFGVRLIAADFDNNGAIDLVGVGASRSRMWLGDASRQLRLIEVGLPRGRLTPVGDLNEDGRIDLLNVTSETFLDPAKPGDPRIPAGSGEEQRVVRLINQGTKDYHWKVINLRAQPNAGDQRVNSFGLGGFIEVRSGLLFQKQLVTGGPVHIGLGTHTSIDVARIVWPNGIPQAEFDLKVDDTIVVEQRLKGSCPWVFTWDGRRMTFVTDFLWRSPLGLRINAQDTAGVTQTEDWVRLRGDQLVPRGGMYDVRITAELWETHFFDHVSLMAVDHPDGTEVYVDERFSASSPPAYRLHALTDVRPVARAWDHRGADVTDSISSRDGRYLATFARGRYQGIAEDHYVEIEPGAVADGTVLVATGWIYPTDSSINVAIAQAGIAPRGLSLEAQRSDGSWRVVNPDIGFPAGKNKTILVDLAEAAGSQRVRLRTNLEIYWDSLQLGSRTTQSVKTIRVNATSADLRYRGFSRTSSRRGEAPETAEYERIESTSPRWRDLTGYHTRFGDVRELVQHVDDRYVIMNAGDELRLQFAEVPLPGAGWRRDFVLIGDGWEKDGDYNTGFSQTVLPLPSHDRPAYGADTTSLELEDDPVYQRHRDDWQRYHTRWVSPQRFLRGLRPQ